MRISDWSSDVCSSDLICPEGLLQRSGGDAGIGKHQTHRTRDWKAKCGEPKSGLQSTHAEWVPPTRGATGATRSIVVPSKRASPSKRTEPLIDIRLKSARRTAFRKVTCTWIAKG